MKLAILTALALFQTSPTRQTVLVINGALVSQNVYWHEDQSLQRYALTHAGTYIAFATAGNIYRVDSPASLQQAQSLYAPMVPSLPNRKNSPPSKSPSPPGWPNCRSR